MKYYELDKEEKSILKALEQGRLRGVRDKKKLIKKYSQAARNTLNRARNINIRISERDIQKIKSRAAEKGIPYQTLVSSIIHQYDEN